MYIHLASSADDLGCIQCSMTVEFIVVSGLLQCYPLLVAPGMAL